MLGSNAEERGILALMFGYTSFGAALRAMDAYGDEQSATLVSEVRSAWEGSGTVPDLSHENRFGHVRLNPSREDVLLACSGLIDAYDRVRELREGAKVNLRKTVEAIFELRAFARLAGSNTDGVKLPSGRDWLQSSLTVFPLPVATAKKLGSAGFSNLESLLSSDDKSISALTGLSRNQISKVHELIFNYMEHHCNAESDEVSSKVSERISRTLGRTIDIRGAGWTDWFRIGRQTIAKTGWQQLLMAIENIAEFTSSVDDIIVELQKLNSAGIDWSQFPWKPDEHEVDEHISYFADYAAFTDLPPAIRPLVEAKIRSYFDTHRIVSLLDVVSHPVEEFRQLGKLVDSEFNLSLKFEFGLRELRPNILFRIKNDRRRTEQLLNLINHVPI